MIPSTICVSPGTLFCHQTKSYGRFSHDCCVFILHSKILLKQKLHVMWCLVPNMIWEPKCVIFVVYIFHVCASLMLFLARKLVSALQVYNVLCLRHHIMKVSKKHASLYLGLSVMYLSLNILSSLLQCFESKDLWRCPI